MENEIENDDRKKTVECRVPSKRPLRRSVTRQSSADPSLRGSTLTVTRKPSVASVLQRVFRGGGGGSVANEQVGGQQPMGSNLSLRMRPAFGRSVSRNSSGAAGNRSTLKF